RSADVGAAGGHVVGPGEPGDHARRRVGHQRAVAELAAVVGAPAVDVPAPGQEAPEAVAHGHLDGAFVHAHSGEGTAVGLGAVAELALVIGAAAGDAAVGAAHAGAGPVGGHADHVGPAGDRLQRTEIVGDAQRV